MLRRAAVVGMVATVALVVGTVVSSAYGNARSYQKLVFFRHQEGAGTFIDTPPKGQHPTQGDAVVFHGVLFDRTNQRRVGAGDGSCVVTHPRAPFASECSITFTIPGGTLVVEGIGGETDSLDLAIVGGTGDFVGRRGFLRIAHSQAAVTKITFVLQQ